MGGIPQEVEDCTKTLIREIDRWRQVAREADEGAEKLRKKIESQECHLKGRIDFHKSNAEHYENLFWDVVEEVSGLRLKLQNERIFAWGSAAIATTSLFCLLLKEYL